MSGRRRYEAVTPESIKITMRIAMSAGANLMTSNTTMTSRWIGAEGGEVK
jgi:hypothetical protein